MKFTIINFYLGATLIVCAAGCSSKPITQPYSEMVETASADGTMLPSIEEERERFFAIERKNQERLLKLIQNRSNDSGEGRDYRVGAGDTLEINVFDVPELNTTAKVRDSGFVTLPLIGAVQASGKTEGSLNDELKRRISSFVKNPQVNLSIAEYGSQKVAVMGAVDKPGSYPLKKGANSILQLIGEAGGVNERAGNYVNFIPSEFSGLGNLSSPAARARLALSDNPEAAAKNSGIEVYLDQILGTGGRIPVDVPVRAGDMIIVPESGKVMLEGEVQKTGSYDLGSQMTMLGALAAAGGITYGAKVDEVEIIREFGPQERARLIVDLTKIASGDQKDVRLRNGDLVRVPSDTSRRFRQDTYEAIGRVINFGVGGQVNVLH